MSKPRKQQKKDLRDRVTELRTLLPSNWREILVVKRPEYDRLHYATFITNVFRGHSTDEALTSVLEEIATEYQAGLNQTPELPASTGA